MMSMSLVIYNKVRDIASDLLGVEIEDIDVHSNIQTDLGADELDMVEFVMAVEEEFMIEIPDEYMSRAKTIRDITRFVESTRRDDGK